MQPDEDAKLKPQSLSQTQKWAIGVGVFLFGLGAWSYKKHGSELFPPPLQPKGLQGLGPSIAVPQPLEPVELTAGPESLEDALSNLESGNGWASQGIQLPESVLEVPEDKAKAPKASKSKASKPKSMVKEPEAEAPQVNSKAKAMVNNLFDKLSLPRKEESKAPASGKKKYKKPKVSGADKEKAQAIIQDALEKIRAAPSAEEEREEEDGLSGDLRDRLEALIAPEEERDRNPDIRKAKGIIKDAIKKMESPKPRKAKASKTKDFKEPEEDEGADSSHLEFAQRLKEEVAQKPDHDLATIRDEFKSEYGSHSRQLLCSGCKLVAARLDSELSNHDVHEAENPSLMLASKRRAIDATCRSLRHLHVATGEGGPRFEASEATDDDGSDAAPRLGQKLCSALLEDAKFEVLSRLIRRKVPTGSIFHSPEASSTNWERMLCAQRARFCKRNEVREDDDEEEL
eukprot:CAMPEP_0179122842 /NCGR_PEP_ID=MMETSP0796-20121207/57992_1 /TAXON_ID=73915 /ORGANISM="Pyrodinium bahamense, Strain pbaha01" /LENGTH=457 /DNA_ID=CAMNT_0020821473 /DNA_START=58 /DNA_END=1431 /DNA_ORIENTATION=-